MIQRNKARVLFTRSASVGKTVEGLLNNSRVSIEAALYRLNNPRLARALHAASERGLNVRVVLDRTKYRLTPATQELLAKLRIPHRLMAGRRGRFAKMHHKFVILDGRTVLAGSYNWTMESEKQNFECLLTIQEPREVKEFAREFDALWTIAGRRRRAHAAESSGRR